MIKVLGNRDTTGSLLTPEQHFEWIDLRGRELKFSEVDAGEGNFSITLDALPQGAKKTLQTLVVLATVAIAAEIAEKYGDDAKLQPTINAFVRDQIKPRVEQVSRYIDAALKGTSVIDMTNLPPIDIHIAERVERDETDVVVSSAIAATIGDAVFVYSSVGVFDPQG